MSGKAHRVSISALLGSPQAPLRPSRSLYYHDVDAAGHARPQHCDAKEMQTVPPMSIGSSNADTPAILRHPRSHAPAALGSAKPHPVSQLDGAVTRGRRGKKHTCMFPGCGREFTRRSNLEAHSRKHMTGERATPYACIHCGRRFKWRSSLKSHEGGCMHQIPMVQQAHQQQQRIQLEKQKQAFRELQQSQGQHQAIHSRQHQIGTYPQTAPPHSNALLAVANAASAAEAGVTAVANAALNSGVPSQQGHRSVPEVEYGHNLPPNHTSIPHRVPRPESHGMLTSLRLPPPGSIESAPSDSYRPHGM